MSAATASRPRVAVRARATAIAWAPVALVALVGVSAVLRSRAIHARFWIDEGLSVGIASHPLLDIPQVLLRDGAPPLYYMLLHVWAGVFGNGEGDTHALSLAFALLTIPAGLWAGRALFGARAGWAVAVLCALNPFLTYYAQETRMYSLLALEGLLVATTFALAFAQHRRAWLPAFSASLAVMIYTHNWGLFLGAGTVVALAALMRFHHARRLLLRDAALAYGAVAVLYLPWLPTLLSQARHTGAPWAERPGVDAVINGLALTLGGESTALAVALVAGSGLAALITAAPASSVLPGGDPIAHARRAHAAVAILVLSVAGIVIAFLASQASPAWTGRYLGAFLGPILLLAGAGLARTGKLGLVTLALIAALWLDPRTNQVRSKSNVHAVGAVIEGRVAPGDLVVSTHPEQLPVLHYYFPAGLRWADAMGPVRDTSMFDWRDALDRLRAAKPRRVAPRLVATLRPGQNLLLVQPIIRTSRWRAPWTRLVRKRAAQWERRLDADPRLERVEALPTFAKRAVPRGVRTVRYRVLG